MTGVAPAGLVGDAARVVHRRAAAAVDDQLGLGIERDALGGVRDVELGQQVDAVLQRADVDVPAAAIRR